MKVNYISLSIQPDQDWTVYTLTNNSGMSVEFLNYGGIITKLLAPDQEGKLENLVLGFADFKDYLENPPYLGALIGRVAGRIKGASFELNGESYPLMPNNGVNHLHGGPNGFHQVVWDGEPFQTPNEIGVVFTHNSPTGAGGYPGTLELKITYSLTNDNVFRIHYEAESDQDTVLTLTNHTYFNLSGDLKATIDDHKVTMASSKFVELDSDLIPTGKLVDVEGTPFDFRNGRVIKDGIDSTYSQNLVASHGYDHYFILGDTTQQAIQVEEPTSGRKLSIETDQPGLVLYTGNTLGNELELNERLSCNHLGVCFETQGSPASLHHEGFPSILLKKGEAYNKFTAFKFTVL